ncbi:hypothetical protein TNCV_1600771 [Trichonephila clavipes]|nr:hypothetical protein TNCV_1600771 [Trichonephila clavipes]
MLNNDEIVTYVQEQSDPVNDEMDENDDNNNNESSKGPSNDDVFSALEIILECATDDQLSKGCSIEPDGQIGHLCEGIWLQSTTTLGHSVAENWHLLNRIELFSPTGRYIGHPMQLFSESDHHKPFQQLYLRWLRREAEGKDSEGSGSERGQEIENAKGTDAHRLSRSNS